MHVLPLMLQLCGAVTLLGRKRLVVCEGRLATPTQGLCLLSHMQRTCGAASVSSTSMCVKSKQQEAARTATPSSAPGSTISADTFNTQSLDFLHRTMANSKNVFLSDQGLPYPIFIIIVRIGAWATLGILATAILVFVVMCVKYGAGSQMSSRSTTPVDLESGSDDMSTRQPDEYQDCPPAYEEPNLRLELPPTYAETEANKPACERDSPNIAAGVI